MSKIVEQEPRSRGEGGRFASGSPAPAFVTDHWPFGALRPGRYRTILADPPWSFRLRSVKGDRKSPSRHYRTIAWERLISMPVSALAAPDCALFLWACAPSLPQAVAVMQGWGFRFVTAGGWAKRTATGKPVFPTGYVWRGTLEFLLVGAIGNPRFVSRSERNLIEAPRREHSRKPDAIYGLVERLIPRGPHAELFARQAWPGWESWGDERGKFQPRSAP